MSFPHVPNSTEAFPKTHGTLFYPNLKNPVCHHLLPQSIDSNEKIVETFNAKWAEVNCIWTENS